MFGFRKAAIPAPLAYMTSMDTKNMFPAARCRREPLRKINAAVPESNPTIAPQI